MYWVKRIQMQGKDWYESWAAGSRLGSFLTVREAHGACGTHHERASNLPRAPQKFPGGVA